MGLRQVRSKDEIPPIPDIYTRNDMQSEGKQLGRVIRWGNRLETVLAKADKASETEAIWLARYNFADIPSSDKVGILHIPESNPQVLRYMKWMLKKDPELNARVRLYEERMLDMALHTPPKVQFANCDYTCHLNTDLLDTIYAVANNCLLDNGEMAITVARWSGPWRPKFRRLYQADSVQGCVDIVLSMLEARGIPAELTYQDVYKTEGQKREKEMFALGIKKI